MIGSVPALADAPPADAASPTAAPAVPEQAAGAGLTPRAKKKPSTNPVPTKVGGVAGNAQIVASWGIKAKNKAKSKQIVATAVPLGASKPAAKCSPVIVGGIVTSKSCTIKGLSNGTAYTVRVRIKNASGAWSKFVATKGNFTPSAPVPPAPRPADATVPAPPAAVLLTAGNGSLGVSWSPPVTSGTSPLTDYVVTATTKAGQNFTGTCTVPAGTLSCTINGLSNGSSYTASVVAQSAVGSSKPATSNGSVTPSGAPTGVSAPRVKAVGTSAAVSVSAASDGGSAITGYTVTATQTIPGTAGPKTCKVVNVPKLGLSCLITKFGLNTTWTFTTTAKNANGSTTSAASAPVTFEGLITHRPRKVKVESVITTAATESPAAPALYSLKTTWTPPKGGPTVAGYKATAWGLKITKGSGKIGRLIPRIKIVNAGTCVVDDPAATSCTFPQPATQAAKTGGPFKVSVRAFGPRGKSIPTMSANKAGLPTAPGKPLYSVAIPMNYNTRAAIVSELPAKYKLVAKTAMSTAAMVVVAAEPFITTGGNTGPGRSTGFTAVANDVTNPSLAPQKSSTMKAIPAIFPIPFADLPMPKINVPPIIAKQLKVFMDEFEATKPYIGFAMFPTAPTTSFVNNHEYTYTGKFSNAYGEGLAFTTKAQAYGQQRPQPPSWQAAAGTGSVTATIANGGSSSYGLAGPTTGYKVSAYPTGTDPLRTKKAAGTCTVSTSVSGAAPKSFTCTVTGLTAGTKYDLFAQAINVKGPSMFAVPTKGAFATNQNPLTPN